jgi:hypothetical protein
MRQDAERYDGAGSFDTANHDCVRCLRPGECSPSVAATKSEVAYVSMSLCGTATSRRQRRNPVQVSFICPGLEAELDMWLRSSIGGPDDFIFPSQRQGVPIRQKNYLRRDLKAIAERAGVPDVNFQALRRTMATHAQKTGATVKDAQAMMRHASPQMTIGVYMQEIPESVKAAVDSLDSWLCGGSETLQ